MEAVITGMLRDLLKFAQFFAEMAIEARCERSRSNHVEANSPVGHCRDLFGQLRWRVPEHLQRAAFRSAFC
jgi:hypothetical protein